MEKKDYSKVIDSILDTVPVFMGACKMETVKSVLKPLLNQLMKQSKAARITLEMLPEKVQQINKLIEDQEALNNELVRKEIITLKLSIKK